MLSIAQFKPSMDWLILRDWLPTSFADPQRIFFGDNRTKIDSAYRLQKTIGHWADFFAKYFSVERPFHIVLTRYEPERPLLLHIQEPVCADHADDSDNAANVLFVICANDYCKITFFTSHGGFQLGSKLIVEIRSFASTRNI